MNVSFYGQESLIIDSVNSYFDEEKYLDLTFICKGNVKVRAHKIVLGSVSLFLKDMLMMSDDEHVYISVPDVTANHMRLLLNYLYVGSTKVNSEELQGFKFVLTLLNIRLPRASVSSYTAVDATDYSSNVNISYKVTVSPTLMNEVSPDTGNGNEVAMCSNFCSSNEASHTQNSESEQKVKVDHMQVTSGTESTSPPGGLLMSSMGPTPVYVSGSGEINPTSSISTAYSHSVITGYNRNMKDMQSTVDEVAMKNSVLVNVNEPNNNDSTDILIDAKSSSTLTADNEQESYENHNVSQGSCYYEKSSLISGQEYPVLHLNKCDPENGVLQCPGSEDRTTDSHSDSFSSITQVVSEDELLSLIAIKPDPEVHHNTSHENDNTTNNTTAECTTSLPLHLEEYDKGAQGSPVESSLSSSKPDIIPSSQQICKALHSYNTKKNKKSLKRRIEEGVKRKIRLISDDSHNGGAVNVYSTHTEVETVPETGHEEIIKKMRNAITCKSDASTVLCSVLKVKDGTPCNDGDLNVDTLIPVIRVKDISSLQSTMDQSSEGTAAENTQSEGLKHSRKDIESNSEGTVIRVRELTSLCSAVSTYTTTCDQGLEVLAYSKSHVKKNTKYDRTVEYVGHKSVQQQQQTTEENMDKQQFLHEFICYICGNIYKDKTNFISHIITHSNRNDYHRVKPLIAKMTNRRSSVEKTKVKSCEWEERKTQDDSTSSQGSKASCLNQKPYKCSKCDASFYLRSRLHTHMQVHLGCTQASWRR